MVLKNSGGVTLTHAGSRPAKHPAGTAYLDHAATSPLRPEAREAMVAQFEFTGNASSSHTAGRRARRTVEEARESIAAALAVRPNDVVLTSGGTESGNLAIKGLHWARRSADSGRRRVLISAVEHAAVLNAADWLERHEGAVVDHLPVDGEGRVDPDEVRGYLAQYCGEVSLVSVMWANNENGAVQPMQEISEVCAEFDIPLHSDGVQAASWLELPTLWTKQPRALSISGHKFGGPIGVGALVSCGIALQPLIHGGGQELGVRSGTLMTAQVAGMAAALEAAVGQRDASKLRLARLRDDLVSQVTMNIPDVVLNGTTGEDRLPGIAQLSFLGCEADALLMLLDAAGVECSAGSACSAGVSRPSRVLMAMGAGEARARSALRFSLGWNSTPGDVALLMAALPEAVARARRSFSRQASRRRIDSPIAFPAVG